MNRLRLAAPDDPLLRPLVVALGHGALAERALFAVVDTEDAGPALDRGEADAVLLPAHQLVSRAASIEVVPGIALSGRGAQGTAVLHHHRPLRAVHAVRSLARGHAAEALLAVLFERAGAAAPAFVDEGAEAWLVAAGSTPPGEAAGARTLDLGEAWTELTGLPFLWHAWAARPGAIDREGYALLHTARSRGRHALSGAVDPRVQYRLGSPQLEGLMHFWEALHRLGRAPEPQAIRFARLGAESACHAKAELLRAAGAIPRARTGRKPRS